MSATFRALWAGDVGTQGPREIRVGLRGPTGPAATKRFAIRLESPTTKDIIWVSGSLTLNSLTYCSADQGSGTGTITIRRGVTVVAGWDALPLDTADPVTVAPDSPVVLTDGALLTITWTGDGAGLSLGFSE